MLFETFDFTSSNQCGMDPTTTYSIENFSNNPGAPFAVVPLNLTKDDFQDLNNLHVENTCKVIYGVLVPKCYTSLSSELEPKSYFEGQAYHDTVENYFKGYKSLKPELTSNLVDLIVRLTNEIAEIIPGILISPALLTYYAEPEMMWHVDNAYKLIGNTHIFLATLKGDHTLYCTGSYNDSYIERWQNCVSDNTDTGIFSASFGFGTIHKTGSLYGAYHSVPPLNEQRLVFTAEIKYPDR